MSGERQPLPPGGISRRTEHGIVLSPHGEVVDFTPPNRAEVLARVRRDSENREIVQGSFANLGEELYNYLSHQGLSLSRKTKVDDVWASFGDLSLKGSIDVEKGVPTPKRVVVEAQGAYITPMLRVTETPMQKVRREVTETVLTPPKSRIEMLFDPISKKEVSAASLVWRPEHMISQKELFDRYDTLFDTMQSVTAQVDEYTAYNKQQDIYFYTNKEKIKQECEVMLTPQSMITKARVWIHRDQKRELSTLYGFHAPTFSYIWEKTGQSDPYGESMPNIQYSASEVLEMMTDLGEIVRLTYDNKHS